jgi:hypothetical protein
MYASPAEVTALNQATVFQLTRGYNNLTWQWAGYAIAGTLGRVISVRDIIVVASVLNVEEEDDPQEATIVVTLTGILGGQQVSDSYTLTIPAIDSDDPQVVRCAAAFQGELVCPIVNVSTVSPAQGVILSSISFGWEDAALVNAE